MEYTYDQMFQRNIGIFTDIEQNKIEKTKIAIIGVGGLGAPATECLSRLGVGELRLVEPDCYDLSNINRQTGAYVDTVNRNKAVVMGEIAKRINPKIKLTIKTSKMHGDDLRKVIKDCDIVIDAIDFFNIEDSIELHKMAKEYMIPIVCEQSCFNITSFTVFDPKKSMLSDLVPVCSREDMLRKVIELTFPVLPQGFSGVDVDELLTQASELGDIAIPSYSVLVPLSGAIITQMIINILIKKDRKMHIPIMPNIMYFDNIKFEIKKITR